MNGSIYTTTSLTDFVADAATRYSANDIDSFGAVFELAIYVCVFSAYSKKSFRPEKKLNQKQLPKQQRILEI